jgi:signal transduction histidine kinase
VAQLRAALLNLVINARDAMPNGGELAVSLQRVVIAGDAVPAANVTPGTYVQVLIRDTGTGISAENLPLVFDPFFTTKPFGVGSGLGLAQVHGFAHQSGGSVTLDSTPGVGTSVTLLLPTVGPDRSA